MRILYLISLENIIGNPIFENQVRKMLRGIREETAERASITVCCILPWIEISRRGIYCNFRKYRSQMETLRRDLAGEGIELVFRRGFVPSAFFQMGIAGLAWFTISSLPAVMRQARITRADIVHCRYYYSTFVAIMARKLGRRGYRIIFDVRSLLAEQAAINGSFSADGLLFGFWKKVERWMLGSAEVTVAVSPAMASRLAAQAPGVRLETIPNFADLNVFRPDERSRQEVRDRLGIVKRRVLVFCGTVGGRYPADMILEVVGTYFAVFGEESFFLLLTHSDEKRLAGLKESLLSRGLEQQKHWNYLKAAPDEVPRYLTAADYSLLVVRNFVPSSGETPWDEYVFPIKFSEYLATGLPLLTHPDSRSIRGMIERYRAGMAIGPGMDTDELRKRLDRGYESMRESCLRAAAEDFSMERFVSHYLALYRELTGKAYTSDPGNNTSGQ